MISSACVLLTWKFGGFLPPAAVHEIHSESSVLNILALFEASSSLGAVRTLCGFKRLLLLPSGSFALQALQAVQLAPWLCSGYPEKAALLANSMKFACPSYAMQTVHQTIPPVPVWFDHHDIDLTQCACFRFTLGLDRPFHLQLSWSIVSLKNHCTIYHARCASAVQRCAARPHWHPALTAERSIFGAFVASSVH